MPSCTNSEFLKKKKKNTCTDALMLKVMAEIIACIVSDSKTAGMVVKLWNVLGGGGKKI